MSFGFGFGFPSQAPTSGGATLDFNFVGATTLNPQITFTRALNTATYFDSTGTLQTANANVARFDYDPSTLAPRGLLIEEARTNSIRNNTMVGAVAGTPGTLPTNWGVSSLGTLTQTVVGVGTVNGINYIDLRFNGTTSTTQISIRSEPSNAVAATNGQTWAHSTWCSVVGGSLTNITSSGISCNLYSSVPAYLTTIINGTLNTTTTLTRTSASGTIANASTAFIQQQITLSFLSGVAIDITLRIGLPQLELGAFATSVIPTSTVAVVRNADVASVNTLTPWYNQSEGTLFAEAVGLMPATLGSNRAVAALSDNTYNNMVQLYKSAGGASWGAEIVSGGGPPQASYFFAVYTQNNIAKIAVAYALNNVNAATNGVAGTTDTSATIPTVTKLELRDPTGAANGQPTAYIRRITYYPRRLANTELQAITA